MKMLTRLVMLFLISASSSVAAWEPAKDQEGIEVFTRKVAGSAVRESLAVMSMETRLASVAALILDTDNQRQWIDSVDESRLLQRVSETESYNYTVSRAPWPVADRDAVVLTTAAQDKAALIVTIQSCAVPDYYPEQKGMVRVKKVDSSWVLSPKAGKKIEIRYQVHSDPGGQIPKWLVNSVVTDQPFNTLMNLRNMVLRSPYREAIMPFIQEVSPEE